MHTASTAVRSIAVLFLFVLAIPTQAAERTILVMGDSLSAAYGVPTESAWVNLLRQRLASRDLPWQVVNASISGETTDGGMRRLPEMLDRHSPDIVIIELGGNDGLRGFPPQVTRDNLAGMITRSREAGATPLLVGMQMPPNYGERYTRAFASIYPELAEKYDIPLVPFFLEGIYNIDGLMQDDGIHPTAEAQPRLLDNLWPALSPLLEAQDSGR
ncbi:arylesterase [Marinobacter sp.]|uniref:arylesterase n=1 Tax=Marinobacter sp. TaxID=50741 RepID=UPI0019CA74E9|nr:arylesterase [Marinobacter sp.]MBC7193526.1 arylesterase [Marinobacter sp.]